MTATRRRPLALGPHDVAVDARPDGSFVLRSPHQLQPYARAMTDHLVHWAATRPEQTYLAERSTDGSGWRTITYRETLAAVRALAQALIDRGASRERGLAILSENGIDHALLGLAAQYAGIPYAPISPAYALLSTDFVKLRHCLQLFDPALIYVNDAGRFARAFAGDAIATSLPVIVSGGRLPQRETIPIDELRATVPAASVEAANAALTPDTVAKILFTSGSTGMPKGVINTQRMMCSNMQMGLQAFPFWAEGMVMLDWSPWNHTAGSNQTFNMVLSNGGTMYIDDGRPTPADFWKTLRNLEGLSPTILFNVPRGWDELARALDGDPALRRSFFAELRMMWYAGAALSAPVFEHLRRLAIDETGEEVLMTSGLGSTETAPSILFANFYGGGSGNVGVPFPGLAVKLAPVNGKLELRVKGPSITPGYLKRDDLTAAAFDDEGYFCTGDALRAADPADFSRGFFFDGRIGEDFKLSTGTWVSVGTLRTEMIAALRPLARDVVICGADQPHLGMLIVGDPAAARRLAGDLALSDDAAFAHPVVRAFVQDRLAAHAADHPGSSTRVVRAIFLDSPPAIDAGEITDKGSLNNAILRQRRAHLVEHLFTTVDHPLVMAIA